MFISPTFLSIVTPAAATTKMQAIIMQIFTAFNLNFLVVYLFLMRLRPRLELCHIVSYPLSL